MHTPDSTGADARLSHLPLALCLLLAQDRLLQVDAHSIQGALNRNVHQWLMDLLDPTEDYGTLPDDLSELCALIDAAWPYSGEDLTVLFAEGPHRAYATAEVRGALDDWEQEREWSAKLQEAS